ncbi:MAG TPA: FtsW/RodA/SpoVE family cell cycle protein, partial [Treponemataceae bacterium]|nr:FtsW/RodA/SpoVE family cell cycle protein [Treponemataceae bacterium]
ELKEAVLSYSINLGIGVLEGNKVLEIRDLRINKGYTALKWLNQSEADFIFAGWAEGMGFFGVILFFALIILFVWRGYNAAFTCKDRFASYAAFGLTSSILLQTLMNCGVVCGALPSTGIPLPFFSSGGSSLMITLVMCGIIINVSKIEKGTEMFYE